MLIVAAKQRRPVDRQSIANPHSSANCRIPPPLKAIESIYNTTLLSIIIFAVITILSLLLFCLSILKLVGLESHQWCFVLSINIRGTLYSEFV